MVGLGFDALSVAPARVSGVKEGLRSLDASDCRRLLAEAIRCGTPDEVAALLRAYRSRDGGREIAAAHLVRLGSDSASREEAVKELLDLLDLDGRLEDADAAEEAVWAREGIRTTAIGFGVAIPHAKCDAVRAASVALLRFKAPVDWDAPDGEPVDLAILLAVPAQGGQEHLRMLAGLSRSIVHEEFRARLRDESSPERIAALLRGALGEG